MANKAPRGRGALDNLNNRFQRQYSELDEAEPRADGLQTQLQVDRAKTIIATNRSPDVPFEQSINPYRGCEHGCIYCYARPSHAYWDLSPGLDFETRIFHKPDAPALLERELQKPGYRCRPIVLGSNTDPYQPVDRDLELTRELLQVMLRFRHPVSLITKGSHLPRDLDILAELAEHQLCSVTVSLTTLNADLKRRLEPRAASAAVRLKLIRTLTEAGVRTGVLLAPIIPALNDREIEDLLQAAAEAGAESAGYVFLRLPREVRDLFHDWLRQHYPARADHVISLIRQSRGDADYRPDFGSRMRGEGVFAELIGSRFRRARARLGLASGLPALDCGQFSPAKSNRQLSLL